MIKQIHNAIAHTIATGFGTGLAPKAPGTVGTLVGIPVYLLMADMTLTNYILLLVILFIVGVWASEVRGRALNESDHGSIVWDEVVGYVITMLAAPSTDWMWVLTGFVLFRIFDILKPWPISWFDKRIKSGFGTMLDDVLAGVFAALVMWGISVFALV